MPRLSPLVISLVVLLASAPNTGAAPVGGLLTGSGNASTFTVFGQGHWVSTGGDQWTLVCNGCLILISFTTADLTRAQSARVDPVLGGSMEFREFVGVFILFENGPHDYDVHVHGYGEFNVVG